MNLKKVKVLEKNTFPKKKMIEIDFNKKLKSEEIEIKNYIFSSVKKCFETLKKIKKTIICRYFSQTIMI